MKAPKLYRTTVNVHPAVKRYLDNHYSKVFGSYDLTKSDLYIFVSSMMARSSVATPSKLSKKYGSFVPINLLITEYDFYHYGWTASALQQYRFSRLFLAYILNNACYQIAMLKLTMNIPRSRAIIAILDDLQFNSAEISYDYLRKFYQRKFQKREMELDRFIKDLQKNWS